MKTALILLLIFLPHFAFTQATQVQIESRYQHIDPAFTKDVIDDAPSNFSMPTVTTKSGNKAIILRTQEFKVLNGAKEADTRKSGVIIEITPTIKDGKIKVIGKSTLLSRDSWQSKEPFSPITFTKRETIFEGTATSKREIVIKLNEATKEELILKLTLIDRFGMPIKE